MKEQLNRWYSINANRAPVVTKIKANRKAIADFRLK